MSPKPTTRSFTPRRAARGFTLVEALVALVVLSVGLLGVAGLQVLGLRGNISAASRTQASYLADDIIDRMRANYIVARGPDPSGGLSLQYDVVMGQTSSGASDAIAVADVNAWLAALGALPAGQGSISVNAATNIATVTIQWVDTRGGDSNQCTGVNNLNCVPLSFQTQTQL